MNPLNAPVSGTGHLSRRLFVAGLGATAAAAVSVPALIRADGAYAAAPGTGGSLPEGVFSLGVASGDPLPDGVVLWTRLAADPLAGGGMPQRPYPVEWELAEDDAFARVVRRGRAVALPQLGHCVHVEVNGLRPGAEYVYRFKAGGQISPVGRTRTAPVAGVGSSLRFAFASCQNWQDGYYAAYEALAAEDVAFVAFHHAVTGLTQASSGNRAKSVSAEHMPTPCSMARAARWASVTRLPRRSPSMISLRRISP